jgi:hypothetical protein
MTSGLYSKCSVSVCAARYTLRHIVGVGHPFIRSDEELAFSVLRYGKILSRKLDNRMQVDRPDLAPLSCQRFPQIKQDHMEHLVPLLTTDPPLSCRTASEASRYLRCSRCRPRRSLAHAALC